MLFVFALRSCFRFGASISKKPARKAAGKTARNSAAGTGGRDRRIQTGRRTERRIFDVRLRLVLKFGLESRRRRRRERFAAIFGERFAGKKNGLLGRVGRGGRKTRAFRTAIFETARFGAAGFVPARGAAIFAAIIATAVFVAAAGFVAARVTALRRSVLGGREITSTGTASMTATIASTAPAKTAAATAAFTTPIAATITAAAIVRAAAIGARSVILRGIVMGRKVLGSGGVRIRLTLVGGVGMKLVMGSGEMRLADSGRSDVAGRLIEREIHGGRRIGRGFGFVRIVRGGMRSAGVSESFAGKRFDGEGG